MRRTWVGTAGAVATVVLVTGCGRSVENLCEDLAEQCVYQVGYDLHQDECISEGERMQDDADDAGCGDEFNAHYDCANQHECAWNTACTSYRAELDSCLATR